MELPLICSCSGSYLHHFFFLEQVKQWHKNKGRIWKELVISVEEAQKVSQLRYILGTGALAIALTFSSVGRSSSADYDVPGILLHVWICGIARHPPAITEPHVVL